MQDVERLAVGIAQSGIWAAPIQVGRKSGIIMDGEPQGARSAFVRAARPALCVAGLPGAVVTVTDWHSDRPFDLDAIYRAVLHEALARTAIGFRPTK